MSQAADLDRAYRRFFRRLKVDPDTGSVSGRLKFAGYPYVGARYGIHKRVRKVLVVGLDAGRDLNPGGGPTRDTGQFQQAITDPDINPHMAGVCFAALRYAFPPEWGWDRFGPLNLTCQKLIGKLGIGHLLPKNPLRHIAFTNFYKWVTKGRIGRRGGQDRVHVNQPAEINLFHREVRILQPDSVVFQGAEFKDSNLADTRKFIEDIADCLVLRHPAYPGKRHPRRIVAPLYVGRRASLRRHGQE